MTVIRQTLTDTKVTQLRIHLAAARSERPARYHEHETKGIFGGDGARRKEMKPLK